MGSVIDKDLQMTRQELGWGVYELRDLRAFVAFSGVPEDSRRVLPWLTNILNPVRHVARVADYSFSDLISLFVVRELLKKGVQPRTIRDAETYLRRKWRTDRPFVTDEIQTDGRRVFVDDEVVAGQIESADLHGQQVIRELVRERLSRVRYQQGAARSWGPARGVVVDPRVQFGEPVIIGTRLPTEAVAEAVRKQGLEVAAAYLDVDIDDARAALAFEDELAASRRVSPSARSARRRRS